MSEENVKKLSYTYEYIVAFSAALAIFSTANAAVWTSPTLPILYGDKSPIPITSEEGSWVVIFSLIGRIITPIPAAWLMDNIGRKKTILIGTFPMIIGWVLILFADSVAYLYVSRLMCGFASGIVFFYVVPTYLGEIASDKIRGSILSLTSIFAKSGYLFTYAIGPFVSIYTMAWILLVPPFLFYAVFSWSPETPYYLLGKGKRDEALKVLARLRNRSNVEKELQLMEEAVKLSNAKRGSYKELLAPDNRRSLIVMLMLAFGSQACGIETMMIYSELIFRKIGNDFMEPAYINIVFGVVFLLGTIVANLLIDRLGRRKLLLFSIAVMAGCSTLLSVFFNYQKNDYNVQFITWLPTCSLLFMIFGAGSGIATLLFSFVGEIFAKHMKAIAGVMFTIILSISGITFSKLFQYMTDHFGYDVMFAIFAGFAIIYIPIYWWIIPETKGKSLDVILNEMKYISK